MKSLIAGSRGSRLAMIQTKSIIKAIRLSVEIKKISTKGDKITDTALANIKGKGFFTREIDDALLACEIDFAVHSLKDLPIELPKGLVIAAIPQRESVKDALVSNYQDLTKLPQDAIIGTSSLRRCAEILRLRPDLTVSELRGNIDTRIKKFREGKYDAIVVAEAGLNRLGYKDYYALAPEIFIPAVCQGALGITTRADDVEFLKLMSKIDDPATHLACDAERSFLTSLEAGCQIPAGAYSNLDLKENKFYIRGFISSTDGQQFITGEESSSIEHAEDAAVRLAQRLLNSGGQVILDSIRK